MLIDLPNDCELYQELLSTPYQELEHSQQSALEQHLLTCSACDRYKGDSDLLRSLLDDLPDVHMEPGLPPRLEELLQMSREEVAVQLAPRGSILLKEGEYSYHRDALRAASGADPFPSYEKISTVPPKVINMFGYGSARRLPHPMRYPVHRGDGIRLGLAMLMLLVVFLLPFLRVIIAADAHSSAITVTDADANINSHPRISVYPPSLSFTAKQGGNSPVAQSFVVTNYGRAGTVVTRPSTNNGGHWLITDVGRSVVALGHLAISVSADTQNLSVGQYAGSVNVILIDTYKATAAQQVFVSLAVFSP